MPGEERTRYYLVSTAGIPNFGDELIAATWLRHLARVAPTADVVLDCVDPASVTPAVTALHPRLRVVSTLWTLCFRHWDAGVDAVEPVVAAVLDPAREPDLADQLGLLRDATVVHLTGGGFLNRMWPAFTGLLAAVAAVAERCGATSAVTGVGLFPPVGGTAELVRSLLSRFDVVDVRDLASARLVEGIGAYSCDDAFLGLPARHDAGSPAPDVMVSVQFSMRPTALFPPRAEKPASLASDRLARRGIDAMVAYVAKTVAEWGAREVGLVECWPAADQAVLDAARRALPGARFYPLAETIREGLPVHADQVWLSTRFHPHLVAAAAGASGVALSLERDYYATKHSSLVEQGSGWRVAPLEVFGSPAPAVPERPGGGGYRPERVAELHAAKAAVAERIYHAG